MVRAIFYGLGSDGIKREISIPAAVKLSPYYSAMANFAARRDGIGADGLVLFNRFYQPDNDVEKLEVVPELRFSDSIEQMRGSMSMERVRDPAA